MMSLENLVINENNIEISNPFIEGIIASIIASVFVYLFQFTTNKINHFFVNKRFKNIFGHLNKHPIYLVIPELKIRNDILDLVKNSFLPDLDHFYNNQEGNNISSERIFPFTDTKSLIYILGIIAKNSNFHSYKVQSSNELNNKLDISFISFGGSTFYSKYLLNDEINSYFNIKNNSIEVKGKEEAVYKIDSKK